jgi:hypothetical protein
MSLIAPSPNPTPYQVTIWGHPNERIAYHRGTVSYVHWLHLEATRWKDKWREAWIEEDKEGLVALMTHREYIKE